jgi:hypothetical protein
VLIPADLSPPYLQRRVQPGAPQYQGDQAVDFKLFCVAMPAIPGGNPVTRLPTVPKAKVTSHPVALLSHITNPIQQFSHIHIDLVGPLPASKDGYNHLFTVVDRSTPWAEAMPLHSTLEASCADALISGWVSRFGVPKQVTSDRGRQFYSSVWGALTRQLGVKMRITTPYHPQSNELVERFHRRLKDALGARMAVADWIQHLPWVLLGLHAAPRDDLGISAAELVYGLCFVPVDGFFLHSMLFPVIVFSFHHFVLDGVFFI